MVKSLLASVPEASKFDRLAVFGGNPKEFDDPSLEADELWEASLNGVLKLTLGWGMEGNMDEIIHCGRWGLDGLVDFVMYFVEKRGVSGGLFEGKLMHEFWERMCGEAFMQMKLLEIGTEMDLDIKLETPFPCLEVVEAVGLALLANCGTSL